MPSSDKPREILVLGIGNGLMGDQGVGVYLVRLLETMTMPGGWGGMP